MTLGMGRIGPSAASDEAVLSSGRKGGRGAVPGPSPGGRWGGGLSIVVPGTMETLGFSEQGKRSRSCRAYEPPL